MVYKLAVDYFFNIKEEQNDYLFIMFAFYMHCAVSQFIVQQLWN